MKKRKVSKVIAVALAAIMVVGMVPMTAFADAMITADIYYENGDEPAGVTTVSEGNTVTVAPDESTVPNMLAYGEYDLGDLAGFASLLGIDNPVKVTIDSITTDDSGSATLKFNDVEDDGILYVAPERSTSVTIAGDASNYTADVVADATTVYEDLGSVLSLLSINLDDYLVNEDGRYVYYIQDDELNPTIAVSNVEASSDDFDIDVAEDGTLSFTTPEEEGDYEVKVAGDVELGFYVNMMGDIIDGNATTRQGSFEYTFTVNVDEKNEAEPEFTANISGTPGGLLAQQDENVVTITPEADNPEFSAKITVTILSIDVEPITLYDSGAATLTFTNPTDVDPQASIEIDVAADIGSYAAEANIDCNSALNSSLGSMVAGYITPYLDEDNCYYLQGRSIKSNLSLSDVAAVAVDENGNETAFTVSEDGTTITLDSGLEVGTYTVTVTGNADLGVSYNMEGIIGGSGTVRSGSFTYTFELTVSKEGKLTKQNNVLESENYNTSLQYTNGESENEAYINFEYTGVDKDTATYTVHEDDEFDIVMQGSSFAAEDENDADSLGWYLNTDLQAYDSDYEEQDATGYYLSNGDGDIANWTATLTNEDGETVASVSDGKINRSGSIGRYTYSGDFTEEGMSISGYPTEVFDDNYGDKGMYTTADDTTVSTTYSFDGLAAGTYTLDLTYQFSMKFAYSATLSGMIPIPYTAYSTMRFKEGDVYTSAVWTASDTITIVVTPHEWAVAETKMAPDCTQRGYGVYECTYLYNEEDPDSQCTATYEGEIPALDHDYDKGVQTKASTCTEEGEITYTCQREGCTEETTGHSYTVAIDALDHDYDYEGATFEWNEDFTACTATYVCQNDESHTVTVDCTLADEITEEADCGNDGTANRTASFTYTDNSGRFPITKTVKSDPVEITIPATGEHSWDEGVVTKEATEDEDGEMLYTCTVCGTTYPEVIPATGSDEPEPEPGTVDPDACEHLNTTTTYTDYVAATTTSEGSVTATTVCDDCGEVLEVKDYTIAMLVPVVEEVEDEAITEGSLTKTNADYSVTFTFDGVTYTIDEISASVDLSFIGMGVWDVTLTDVPITEEGSIEFEYEGLGNVESGETVSFTIPEINSENYKITSATIEAESLGSLESIARMFWSDWPYVVEEDAVTGITVTPTAFTAVAVAANGTEYPIDVTINEDGSIDFSVEGLPDGKYDIVVSYDLTITPSLNLFDLLPLDLDVYTLSSTDTYSIYVGPITTSSSSESSGSTGEGEVPSTGGESGSGESGETETGETETGETETGETETGEAEHEHDFYIVASQAATCTEEGWVQYACSICGLTETTFTEALGHDFVDGVCTRCGAIDPDYVAEETGEEAGEGEDTETEDEFTEAEGSDEEAEDEEEDEFTEVEEDEFDVVEDESTTSPSTGASMAAIATAMAFAAAGVVVVTRKKKEDKE